MGGKLGWKVDIGDHVDETQLLHLHTSIFSNFDWEMLMNVTRVLINKLFKESF